MHEHLLQPPKLNTRTFATIVGTICGVGILGAVLAAAFGSISATSLAVRSVLVAALGAVLVLVYARLRHRAASIRPERLPWVYSLASFLGMAAVYGVPGIMLANTSFAEVMPLWMIALVAGFTLMAAGWARRVGESLHCPNCEYEFNYPEGPNAPPAHCPECEFTWLGRLLRGRPVRSRRIIALGAAVVVLGTIVMNPIFYLGWLAPHLPTPVLYSALYASPRSAYTAWNELAVRALSPRWAEIMGDRVIAFRLRSDHDRAPGRWFEAAAKAGLLPAASVDRFYIEGFEASIQAPDRVRAGEPFDVSLRVRRALHADSVLGVFFAGYAVDDGPPIVGRHSRTLWAHDLDPGVLRPSKLAQTATLRIDTPGTHRLRAVYFLSYQRSFTDELSWLPDGTPARPAGAVWFRRFEIGTTITVE